MTMNWSGIMPAITTAFNEDLSIDYEFIAKHANWLVANGCSGIVANGTLGEAATLSFAEKVQLLQTCVAAVGDRVPVVAGIGAMATQTAVALAKEAEKAGCRGLMVLPPYQYSTDWREMKAHVVAIIAGTELPCMLYNDPSTYQTDFLPKQIAELAREHSNLCAVKEATTDVRRITAIQLLLGDRLSVLVGMDDVMVEGIAAGATGCVVGTANALPKDCVSLCNAALVGDRETIVKLYQWMLPLMRLNTIPKFVQATKLLQQSVGWGNTRVRPPRLELEGAELQAVRDIIETALANPPQF